MEKIDLNRIYKRKKNDRDIFQELMPFKVKEILLVANYYDAYTIEREGQFSDKIFGEYLQLNLFTAPRFTSVASESEALKKLRERHYDLIIIMAGLDKQTPLIISRNIKKTHPHIKQLMLVNNNGDLAYFHRIEKEVHESIERLFVWNGSTKVFLAMAKYLEDRMNLEADTRLGDVRVILVVEDSVKYYSRYLPLLYTEIMTQTQKIIADEPSDDELGLILKIRVRPKVILVSTYEDAIEIIDKYKNNIIGVISDVRYAKNGIEDEDAGVELIKYVQRLGYKIPCLLQSHEEENAKRAEKIHAEFINKNSLTLAQEIKTFIKTRLGFGNFIFRDKSGHPIDKATSIKEFRRKLTTIPDESLEYHSIRNGISTWLMARGEINLAQKLRRYSFEYFKNTNEIRQFIANVFESSKLKKIRGRIIPFRPELVDSNRYITRLGLGSLGGKGRGLAFLSNFIENVYLKKLIPNLKIAIPKTAIIGVEEFDNFLELNDLYKETYINNEYDRLKKAFQQATLSLPLKEKLRQYLQVMTKPLAVRSSGLFEDSLSQPFAGVYATYLIPNNHPDFERRLEELEDAIKLVYASVFSDESRAYFKAIDSMIEEEKMGVIIQEVIGNEHNGRYYPDISGVAQSYNFYPFSYIRPEDGFAVTAIGLGTYVVGGEKTHRFSPAFPKLQLASIQDKIRSSQNYFYAIDMKHQGYDLIRDGENAAIKAYDLKEAERDGTLEYSASVYDFMNDRIVYDLNEKGPRIIDFAKILQYDYIPLASTLQILLDIFSQAMGSPVEIEFSLNIEENVPVFYLLQIKPLIKNEYSIDIDTLHIDQKKILLQANKGMGNGKLQYIRDVVYIDPRKFDRLKTREMAEEVKQLNAEIAREEEKFILIGPGRWGTRDPLTGIPVQWSDIANAKIIVEQGLPDFPLDASLGSHFFHNVTSMNIGYFAIPFESPDSFIRFDVLEQQDVIHELTYARRVRFKKPLTVWMDGKKQTSVITY
ncbi:PEP/pyruvate-binding domain-containing protein [Gabonibacter chumensis]|uniref:PEP/pyruvate-binding domain-containing protein n=1 Tax=Gabonibacter chumensis TaxID=2972474 RepID=UPI002573C29A|nr:PEP/pyruvate-binding domain-containing protein [Gabonibacter chumensis]MCR9012458.1 pyruvate, phosphate dikinase [Gabonibacter chumensis]